MKEINWKTKLEEVRKAPLRLGRNPELKLRKGGWYYDNRGAMWTVITLCGPFAKVCGIYRAEGLDTLDREFSSWHVTWTSDHGWHFTNEWYLVDEIEKTPGFDKLKTCWLQRPEWNEEILKTFEISTSWEKKDWALCFYLGPRQMCLPHNAEKLLAKRGKNDE